MEGTAFPARSGPREWYRMYLAESTWSPSVRPVRIIGTGSGRPPGQSARRPPAVTPV